MALGFVNEKTLKEAGYTRYSSRSLDHVIMSTHSHAFWQKNIVDGVGIRFIVIFYEFEVVADSNGGKRTKFKCETTLRRQSGNSETFDIALDLGSGAGVEKYEATVEEMFILLGCNYYEQDEHLSFRNVEPYESLALAAAFTRAEIMRNLPDGSEINLSDIQNSDTTNLDLASGVSQYQASLNCHD